MVSVVAVEVFLIGVGLVPGDHALSPYLTVRVGGFVSDIELWLSIVEIPAVYNHIVIHAEGELLRIVVGDIRHDLDIGHVRGIEAVDRIPDGKHQPLAAHADVVDIRGVARKHDLLRRTPAVADLIHEPLKAGTVITL